MPRISKIARPLSRTNVPQSIVEAAIVGNVPSKPFTSSDLRAGLSYHWDTLPPNEEQLAHAKDFFHRRPPKFLWSAEKFKTMDYGSSPEVCFVGRSNVGKSSLLNALLNKHIAFTSSNPGRTKLMNAFAVGGEDRGWPLVVLDMPGYGHGGRAEWGVQIMKYLEKRKELKRAFLLVDADHGIKETDIRTLAMFKSQKVPYQVILSKADKLMKWGTKNPGGKAMEEGLLRLDQMMRRVKDIVQPDLEEEDSVLAIGEIISCSSTRWMNGKERPGINAVRFAMLKAAGLEMKPKVKLSSPSKIVSFEELGMQ
ncbi:uncharacterized protein L3040_001088 [Drepanopeziza brunnea f. sp. 'multigermtubi']|uniref:uncharacterized protein n=1 Tax=Drepanopeziza brunnea f. sp. 'multigermtubi' TaxID=698441 RepID=UPI0023A5B2E4|nr:hypothetical protein L3040_001088 [Drepanopeziza brunnea f. sp. 'multigermtubi']